MHTSIKCFQCHTETSVVYRTHDYGLFCCKECANSDEYEKVDLREINNSDVGVSDRDFI